MARLWIARSIRLVESKSSGIGGLNLFRGSTDHAYDLNLSSRGGNSARIYLNLAHRDTSSVIWAESITIEMGDFEGSARRVASTVTQHIESHQIQQSAFSPGALSPFVLVANADRHLLHVELPSIRKARQLYRTALKADEGNIRALTGLARTYWLEWLLRAGDDVSLLSTAQEMGRKALILRPDSHFSHRELGMIALYARRHDLALEHLSRALTLLPEDPALSFDFADALISNGQAKEGIALARAVRQSDSRLATFQNWVVATGQFLNGDYQDAINELTSMPDEEAGFRVKAASYAMSGDRQMAEVFRRKALAANPTFSVEAWSKGIPIRDGQDLQHVIDGFRRAGFK